MKIILIPFIAGFIAQLSKFFIASNQKKFNFKHIFDYSGMPSGHSALVVSLSTILYLEFWWQSPVFALSVIWAFTVIQNALGVRRYVGRHGQIINKLIKDLKQDKIIDEKYPHLLEEIGHTPTQVAAGALIGFLVSVLGYYII